jgi:hypothetical protein
MDNLLATVCGHEHWANAFESRKYTFAALEIQKKFE